MVIPNNLESVVYFLFLLQLSSIPYLARSSIHLAKFRRDAFFSTD